VRRLLRIFTAALFLSLAGLHGAYAAGAGEAESPPEDARPELPEIGGAQDIWPFTFGLQAGYEDVLAVLGEPSGGKERVDEEGKPTIVRWRYAGLVVTFLENSPSNVMVLTVRFTGPEYPMRGGLALGMPIEDAFALMGEPRVVNGKFRVYFYNTTTIELLVDEGRVAEVVVARAMP
jgi:hypothetical protein